MKFYISTYTEGFFNEGATGAKGIYLCNLDNNGKIEIEKTFSDNVNPSFIKLSHDKKFLYVASETLPPDHMYTYKVRDDYSLEKIDTVTLDARSCCYITGSIDQSFVAAVQYGSGEVYTYAIDENGKFEKETSSFVNNDLGPNSSRQEHAHAHSVRLIEGLDVYVACDLGCDRLDFYNYKKGGYFTKSDIKTIKTKPGSGPRHTEDKDSGKYLYVTCELSNELCVYELIDKQYLLKQIVKASVKEDNAVSDIHFNKCKDRLFVSNRGEDTIVEYSVNADGTVDELTRVTTNSNEPRNFAVDEDYLICANQSGNRVTVLEIKDKKLTGKVLDEKEIILPVCVEIIG